ncbi:HEAT repeat domain-containing protein [Plantibacter sp. Mn2098]|uniref:HEAT repeat domain-containing protein n=1 Tax=Plantibacter sp. Mn2098 TaxID=3395266 RepID=UPI003BE3BBED
MAHNIAPESGPAASIEERLQQAVAATSESAVADRARSLLEGNYEGEDFLRTVGGPHAEGILEGAPALYWPELWGTRALLYVWDDKVAPSVVAALSNRAWRVREMAARVCVARGIGDVAALVPLTTDEHERVRAAGARALGAVGDEAARPVLDGLLRDPDREVRRAAQQSIKVLVGRLA